MQNLWSVLKKFRNVQENVEWMKPRGHHFYGRFCYVHASDHQFCHLVEIHFQFSLHLIILSHSHPSLSLLNSHEKHAHKQDYAPLMKHLMFVKSEIEPGHPNTKLYCCIGCPTKCLSHHNICALGRKLPCLDIWLENLWSSRKHHTWHGAAHACIPWITIIFHRLKVYFLRHVHCDSQNWCVAMTPLSKGSFLVHFS